MSDSPPTSDEATYQKFSFSPDRRLTMFKIEICAKAGNIRETIVETSDMAKAIVRQHRRNGNIATFKKVK